MAIGREWWTLLFMNGFQANKFVLLIAFGLLGLQSQSALSEELVFTYWTDALEPFAIRSTSTSTSTSAPSPIPQLGGGIIKDIGDELSARMSLKPKYKEFPTKRVAIELRDGHAHVTCLTNPKWQKNPDEYWWSPVLFMGTDNFLVRQENKQSIKSFSDLEGKRVGTYNGYVYREEIMQLFEQQKAERIQVPSFDIGMKMVRMGRIDTLIDFGSIIEYEVKKENLSDRLTMASAVADEFDFYCKYSPKIPYDVAALNGHLEAMKEEGFFTTILDKYR